MGPVDMSDKLKLVFHLFSAIHFTFGCYYDWNYVKIPQDVHQMGFNFAGKLKFLTYWDGILQSVFFSVCVLNDLVGNNEIRPNKPPLIRKLKDYLLTCIAFPVAMFVGLTFWGLYAVDRELVFPRALDPFFPTWLNHVMHTNIMIFILIEMATSFRNYPKRKNGLAVLMCFMVSYLVWMHIVYYNTGVWVYPVMEVLNLPMRWCFFAGLLGLTVALYIFGEFLNGFIWAKEKTVKSKSGRNKVK